MRKLLILLVIIALGVGAWVYFGGLDRVTEARVNTALTQAGVPQPMADCMAPRMVERLSIIQLRKLERIGAQDGETAVPLTIQDALARIRRVDDPQAIEVTVAAAGVCVVETALQRL